MRELTLRPRSALVFAAAFAAVTVAACARQVRNVQLTPGAPAVISELWQAPLEPRDLFHGPGGKTGVPREKAFTFVAEDTTGWSPGFDVRDDSGMEWSVKTGPEAQTERLSKLSDSQWNDAFRSGGFTAEQTARYTAKIKEKIAQGLQVTTRGN
jgi:hypothetical protein